MLWEVGFQIHIHEKISFFSPLTGLQGMRVINNSQGPEENFLWPICVSGVLTAPSHVIFLENNYSLIQAFILCIQHLFVGLSKLVKGKVLYVSLTC